MLRLVYKMPQGRPWGAAEYTLGQRFLCRSSAHPILILVSLFHLDSSDCSVVPGPSEAGPETIRNGIPQKSGGYRANCTRGPYPERPQGVFPGSYTLVSSSSNGGLHCSGELAQRHQHRIRLLAELAVTRRGRARATERLHRCHGALSRCCRARC
jgi:hypothetical protein